LHTNALDEALGLPTPAAAKLALRTQQILAHESGVTDTVDPLGGSYYVEALTAEIENRVWDYLNRIDKLGGSVAAIEQHFFQNEIAAEAYRYQKEIETDERIVVGVNRFADEEKVVPPIMRIDPALEEKQRRRIAALRARRNPVHVENALKSLRARAESTDNLLPVLIDCVENLTTLGEISNTLRAVWGEYEDKT
jgi:methylmalonyl-CoA mutase N-terminal domain/subunit